MKKKTFADAIVDGDIEPEPSPGPVVQVVDVEPPPPPAAALDPNPLATRIQNYIAHRLQPKDDETKAVYAKELLDVFYGPAPE